MANDQQPHEVATSTKALLDAAFDDASAREPDALAAMNGVCARLGLGLTRWIGADGWHALLERAVADVAGSSRFVPLTVEPGGVIAWHRDASTGDVRPLFLEVLDRAVLVLERFVGTELTATLVEQAFSTTAQAGDHDE